MEIEEKEVKTVHSTKNHLQLIRVQPESFAGINKDRKIVIMIPEDAGIVGLEGDEGVGKTSALSFIQRMLGGDKVKNFENSTDRDAKGELEFKNLLTGTSFIVRETKKTFAVKQKLADGTVSAIDGPFVFLQQTFGPVGTSPMFLKQKKGKEQIAWLRNELYHLTEEQKKEEAEIDKDFERKYKERTAVNNNVKRLSAELSESRLYRYDKENETYIQSDEYRNIQSFIANNSIDEETIETQFNEAQKLVTHVNASKAQIESLERQNKVAQEEIENLQKEIADRNNRMVKYDEFIVANKDADDKLTELREKTIKAGDVKLSKRNLELADKVAADLEGEIQQQILLNADVDELRKKKKEYIARFTPEIEGLEVVVEEGIDNPRPEGIYYKGHPIIELSESELWGLYMQLCKVQGINVITIENITSLGSNAIDILNDFVSAGGYVFYSAMERNETQLKATFHKQL
jgi:hypothetical protein